MNRDPRLRGLSLDHHRALKLAHRIIGGSPDDENARELRREARRAYSDELRVHFQIEEELLLPGLRAAGKTALVERVLAEHGELGRLLEQAELSSSHSFLVRFAQLLESHVRLEERELFPAAAACLPDETLAQVQARAQQRGP